MILKDSIKNRIKIWKEYSVFKCERFNEEKKRWFKEYSFYWGDCKHIFEKDDWRFCEVKGKRKLAEYMGKGWFKFPIKFPAKLDNGIILNEFEKP